MEVFGYYREKGNDQKLKNYKFNYAVHTIGTIAAIQIKGTAHSVKRTFCSCIFYTVE